MDSRDAMRQCLEEMDVDGARSLWHLIAPNMSQPANDLDAAKTLHMARTSAKWMTSRQRYYSHRWLLDHNTMSLLPDELKPAAERMFPQVISSVGISVNGRSDLTRPIIPYVRSAMEGAVLEAYADGKRDDIPHIKTRMHEARATTVRKLLGI